MSLELVTKNYEILVRFNENGKIGAQLQQITLITNDGVVLSSKLEDPKPVSYEELSALVGSWTQEDWFIPAPQETVEEV